MSGGLKFDSDKPDLSLIPRSFLDEVAKALMFGEKKYSRYNYREGFQASRLVGAALRHITAWMWVEDLDPESGLNHLAHAGASLAMLIDNLSIGKIEDNRPRPI